MIPRAAAAVVLATLAGPSRGTAQGTPRPEILPPACEAELALSAAPAHLRNQAAVWALEESGYVRAREGSNGFACIVNRDDPRSLKPTCFDAEGVATMIPRIELVGRLLLEGAAMAAIEARVEAAFAAGELVRPRRAGVAYMLSPHNRPWDAAAGRPGRFPPHVMIYAPDVSNADIGTDPDAPGAPGLPFVGYRGPHGFIILVSGDLPPGVGDFRACPAWVTEETDGPR